MDTHSIRLRLRRIAGALALLATALLPTSTFADGTETLGPPSIAIGAGTDLIAAGTGLVDGPASIDFDVPIGASVVQVLLYWEGQDIQPPPNPGDDTAIVNGIEVTGTLIGGPIEWLDNGVSHAYRADITGLELVADGANSLAISGIDFQNFTNGAGVYVIVDDQTSPAATLSLVDGNDLAFIGWPEPKQSTVPQTFTFASSAQDRVGELLMHVSAVSGTASSGGTFRPTAIEVTVGGVTTEFNNILDSLAGQEWDVVVLPLDIPAGVTDVTVQIFSEDRLSVGGLPASLTWNAGALNIQNPPPPDIEICTLVTLHADMVSDFSDADVIGGDGCDVFPQSIPVGVVGAVDGTYRLKVTNSGAEPLDNVRINAPDFGLVDAPIPCFGGSLEPGEMCVINFGDPDFSSLKMFDVCDGPGDVIKSATADGEGAGSGIPVSDDDPATVECVAEPAIALRKEVSVDGGPFLDANSADSAPTGPLGADAEYRFVVENTGTETLVDAVINDATLNLVDVPVPGGPLAPGDVRTITQDSVGFSQLFFPDRCDSVGIVMNIARVDATGETTGASVESEDPAYVACEDPRIELLKQVSIDGVNFFDADGAGDPDVPVGIVGLVDATYRLIVTNIGSEVLTNVLVEDATLGISVTIADLAVGETRIIGSGDIGFGNLFQPMRCGGQPGNKSNIATVNAEGGSSGTPVTDENPANLRCIVGPEIELLKQVSLDGVNFVDADTPADGPTGLLGANATYRLIARNVGDEDLTDLTIDDSTLGISGAVVPDLPIDAEVVIDVGSFGGFQELFAPNRCDSVGAKLNTAQINAVGATTGTPVQDDNPAYVNCEAPLVCEIAVDKTCIVEPQPNNDLLCESAIAATTLRYTGPSIGNATVTFEGKKNGSAIYSGVDLVSGVTVLTMAGQNGFTIDSGVQLGSKTTITINGEEEIIHTSCSAVYVAGAPAPLDGNTPNPPNSEKGDPSPNWFVVNFRDKDGALVEETQTGGTGADSCTVPFGGANVTYAYNIDNLGTTSVDVTSVLDDVLGEQLATPPAVLGPGDSLNLTAGPVFVDRATTNVVTVNAQVSGDPSATCPVQDTVVVDVEPPPQLPCKEIKPITQLSMVWNGASGVDVLTETGQQFTNIQNGNRITFNAGGVGNDVELMLSGAASGSSAFHVSCSDADMNGPEDCGGNQGNGKKGDSGNVNDWLLDAMIGENGAFTCELPNTGDVDPEPGGGSGNAVRAELKEIKDKEYKLNVFNDGNADVTIVGITISWPIPTNEELKEIKVGGTKVFDTRTTLSPLTVTTFKDKIDKRRVKTGDKKEVKFKFEKNAATDPGSYGLVIEFDSGATVTL